MNPGTAFALLALSALELYQQGTVLFEKGRLGEASQNFEQARKLAPKDARIWKALGASYAAAGDYQRANEPFHQACSLEPALEDACYFYGRNLYALNRFDAALPALQQALASARMPWRVHLGIAQAHEGLGTATEAEPSFRKAVGMFESLPANQRGRPDFDPRLHYAIFLYRQGRLTEALQTAGKAANTWPQYGRIHFEMGRILHQQGMLEQAAQSLEKAIQYGEGRPAHLLLGQMYLRLGRAEEAHRHLTAGAKSEPAP